jgi:hypothetical protein
MKWRHDYPKESRLWVVRRTIFGDSVKPTQGHSQAPSQDLKESRSQAERRDESNEAVELVTSLAVATKLPRYMMSSLTESQGDFDIVLEETEYGRRGDQSVLPGLPPNLNSAPGSLPRFLSCVAPKSSIMDVISELEELDFQHIPSPRVSKKDLVLSLAESTMPPPSGRVDTRWSEGMEDETKVHANEGVLPKYPEYQTSAKGRDAPIQVPKRRMSPLPV